MKSLHQIICASFCIIVVLSNILSAKMVELPLIPLSIPAGLITYPLTFLLSDFVTEIFGARKAQAMVAIAFAMNLLSFGLIQFGIALPTQDPSQQKAIEAVLGLSGLRIFSSLIAYATSQTIGIQTYAALKRWTGPSWIWVRSNTSTWLSQIVDTVLIDLLYLGWGLHMPIAEVAPIMLFSFIYKAFFSVACTPVLYLLLKLRKFTTTQGVAL
jgi:uncharacterized integral membrane protein (TIGR00697 family)